MDVDDIGAAFGESEDDEEEEEMTKKLELSKKSEKGASIGILLGDIVESLDTTKTTDSNTIHVRGMGASVTDDEVFGVFGKYGRIIRVKVYRPDGHGVHHSSMLNGDVTFLRREDAESAMFHLWGASIGDREVELSWTAGVQGVVAWPEANVEAGEKWIAVKVPEKVEERRRIDRLADFVASEGHVAEAKLMGSERGRALFPWLWNVLAPEHEYYRWRLVSILEGDSFRHWRAEAFQIRQGGTVWFPPRLDIGESDDTFVDRGMNEQGILAARERWAGTTAASAWEDDGGKALGARAMSGRDVVIWRTILKNITPDRSRVEKAACWVLDNPKLGREALEILSHSLHLPNTPLQKRLGRLYILAEIILNLHHPLPFFASLAHVAREILPSIFDRLHNTIHNLEKHRGRVTASAFRARVERVLQAWLQQKALPDEFLLGLQSSLNIPLPLLNHIHSYPPSTDPMPSDLLQTAQKLGLPTQNTNEAAIQLRLQWRNSFAELENKPELLTEWLDRILPKHQEKTPISSSLGTWSSAPQDAAGEPLTTDEVQNILKALNDMQE